MIPLFQNYPLLAKALPHVSLGKFPTPVLDGSALDADQQCAGITIKHDGLTGWPYGGNKVRKLEFLLAEALARGKTEVLTFGGAGSNHALATAIYAQKLGLTSHSMLIKQPNSNSVQHNLLRYLETNAKLQQRESKTGLVVATLLTAAGRLIRGKGLPYFIPIGGTSSLGLLGYVNAAFELHQQIQAGELATPDVIYITSGTMGSFVGLALGFQLLGMKIRICSVSATDTSLSSMLKAKKLFEQANALLCEADKGIVNVPFEVCDIELRHEYYGGEYGLYTQAAMAAIPQVKEATGLTLEGCYTGKCCAALIDDLSRDRLQGQQVLFWNTYDAQGKGHALEDLDYHRLPDVFHHYFESAVQPLDRNRGASDIDSE